MRSTSLVGLAPLCIIAFLALVSTASAAPFFTVRALAPGSNATLGRTPDKDPFYTCPRGFASQPAGAILRQRFVTLNFTDSGPAKVKSAQQILYRTVDVFGKPSCTVTTILQPFNQLRYPTRIMSYHFAEDSPAIRCAPSYQLLTRGSETNTVRESILVNLALSKGYVVTMPDYQGPKSAFTVGTLAAKTVLDGVRASLQVSSVVPDPSKARVVLYGYSGGSLASGWAAQEAPVYAPELNIVGAVLGGHIVNIKSILLNLNNGPSSDLVAAGIAGQRNVFPALRSYFESILSPAGTALLNEINGKCLNEIFSTGERYDFFSFANVSQEEIFANPAVVTSLNSGTLGLPGSPVPQVPLYVFNSVEDEIIVPTDVDGWVSNICARGAPSVQHVRIASGGHVAVAATGAPGAFNWVEARFQKFPAPRGCFTQSSVQPLLDPLALLTVGNIFLNLLNLAAQGRIGPPIGF